MHTQTQISIEVLAQNLHSESMRGIKIIWGNLCHKCGTVHNEETALEISCASFIFILTSLEHLEEVRIILFWPLWRELKYLERVE